jgi:hypothetical protein
VKAILQNLPSLAEFLREALILIGGAILAALFFEAAPGVKAWVAQRLPTTSMA